MNHCKGCKLEKSLFLHPICIPFLSKRIDGCIISRDPTFNFLEKIKEYNKHPSIFTGNFSFGPAPPKWLFKRIGYFMDYSPDDPSMVKLQEFLDKRCYWTHFHKCPTQKKGKRNINPEEKYPSFHYSTAKWCANSWFESEFNRYLLKDKIIIKLGRHVEQFFNQSEFRFLPKNKSSMIALPHPSAVNKGNIWSWNRNCIERDTVENEIRRLISLI